jgi:hypothetical protein
VTEPFQAAIIAQVAKVSQYISGDDNTSSDSVGLSILIDDENISLDLLLDEVTVQFNF